MTAPHKTLEEKIDEIHEFVIRHDERLTRHEAAIAEVTKAQVKTTRVMLLAMGAIMVLGFLSEHRQLLKLLSKE